MKKGGMEGSDGIPLNGLAKKERMEGLSTPVVREDQPNDPEITRMGQPRFRNDSPRNTLNTRKDKVLVLDGALTSWVNQYFWVSISFSVCFVYSVVVPSGFRVRDVV
jgi:hypothetical protein